MLYTLAVNAIPVALAACMAHDLTMLCKRLS